MNEKLNKKNKISKFGRDIKDCRLSIMIISKYGINKNGTR